MLEIQRLQPTEIERLRQIRLAALKDAPDAFGSTYQAVAAWPEDRWRSQLQTLPTFIAVLDGMDRGIVRGVPHSEQATIAYLLSMWVAPQGRGQGIGDTLIDAVIDLGKTAGYQRIVLDMGENNQPAIALYTRQGFQLAGVISHLPPPREHIQEFGMALEL